METKHTKGHWARNIKPASKYCTIYAGRNTHICNLSTLGLSQDEIEANANLIAAAPSLLAECKRAQDELASAIRDGTDHLDIVMVKKWFAGVSAVIAASEGSTV